MERGEREGFVVMMVVVGARLGDEEWVVCGGWDRGGDQQDAEFLSIPSFRAKSIDERLEAFKVTGPVVGAELQPAE